MRSTYSENTHYAHQCNELADCTEEGETYYACNCITGIQHTTDVVTMEHTTVDGTPVTIDIRNICEDINECLEIDEQTSWAKTTEYAGHIYGGCPVDSVDCFPQ